MGQCCSLSIFAQAFASDITIMAIIGRFKLNKSDKMFTFVILGLNFSYFRSSYRKTCVCVLSGSCYDVVYCRNFLFSKVFVLLFGALSPNGLLFQHILIRIQFYNQNHCFSVIIAKGVREVKVRDGFKADVLLS